ncbi:MAG TPA: hypothetical protein VFE98_09970 [Candidatus Bathyarchaeia archaeon]|nr:hypothetical protein [Candidatus Bathyarchaeia archaeon]
MIVVDAAPLIYYSRIARLELLKQLYDKLVIPQAVWDEVVTNAQGRPGASEVEKGVREGWINTMKPSPAKMLASEGTVGADAEVIALARKMKLPLLTNDRTLALIAKTHGVKTKWLTQTVIEAVHDKIITRTEARKLLRDLVRAGLRVRSEVLTEVIHMLEK